MQWVTEQLTKFIIEVSYDDLLQNGKQKVKNTLIDSIGCGLGRYITDKASIVIGFVRKMGGNSQATIIDGSRTSASNAAFANGELINALDPDCIGPLTSQVIPYVLPSCFAAAEINHSSEKEIILATAIVAEMGERIEVLLLLKGYG